MLFLKLLILWTVWFRTADCLLPGVLLALANIQNQRAKGIVNALNWRAKNQYNLALARSKSNLANLGDRHFIRNPRNFLSVATNPDQILLANAFDKQIVGQKNNGYIPNEKTGNTYHNGNEPYITPEGNKGYPISERIESHLYPPNEPNPNEFTETYSTEENRFAYPENIGPPSSLPMNEYSDAPDTQAFKFEGAITTDTEPNQNRKGKHLQVMENIPQMLRRNEHEFQNSEDFLPPIPFPHQGSQDFPSEEPFFIEDPHMIGSTWDGDDERLGTFPMPIFNPNHAEYPDFRDPDHFNPNIPQNFQGVVRFIEEEQRSIERMIHDLDKTRLHFHSPGSDTYSNPPHDQVFTDSPSSAYDDQVAKEKNSEDPKSRASVVRENAESMKDLNMDDINFDPTNMQTIFPKPTAPLDLNHFHGNSQQEIIAKYFENEQTNVQRALQDVLEQHQRNMDNLLRHLSENQNANNVPLGNPANIRPVPNNIDEDEDHIEYDREGVPLHPFSARDAEEENKYAETSTGVIPNDSERQNGIGYSFPEDPVIGHIIQVPEQRYSEEYYQRHVRSLDGKENLEQLLEKEKETINELRECAKHDEDLMMIGYIGESFIDDLRNRLNKTRAKRQLDAGSGTLPITRLFNDPKMKFDMPKTLENLGAVARSAFEYDQLPMYHMRNMMGSAKDAVVAAMKIPNQHFIIPSGYDIVETQPNGIVGDINPSLFSENDGVEGNGDNSLTDTFQKVGSVIRGSILSGQQALGHVGNMANHAKNAIYSTRHALPKVIMKNVPAFARQPKKQTLIITPRIFDMSEDDNKLGNPIGERGYVKVGNVFDALGVSSPNPSVNFEKITIEPRGAFSDSGNPNIKVENIGNVEKDEDFVGSTLDNLEIAKTSFGANNLKDLILKMKQKLQARMNENVSQRRMILSKALKKSKVEKMDSSNPPKNQALSTKMPVTKPALKSPLKTRLGTKNVDETVGASFIPNDLWKPFLNQPTQNQLGEFIRVNTESGKTSRRENKKRLEPVLGAINPMMFERMFNERLRNSDKKDTTRQNTESGNKSRRENEKDLGPVLGAINPMMFERIFNERLRNNDEKVTPQEIFQNDRFDKQLEDDEKVSTSMLVTGQILKPFMGQATGKNRKDFFKKYQPEQNKKDGTTVPGYETEFKDSSEESIEDPDWLYGYD